MVQCTLEQRVFMCDAYAKYGSARNCWRKFRLKFRDERDLSRQAIHDLVNKHRSTGLLIDNKQKRKRRVLTEEELDDIGTRLEHTRRKSLKHLAQETSVEV
jgi:transposase